MRFRPEQHLRRQSDIRGVRENGRRIDCRVFTLWWRRRDEAAPTSPKESADSISKPRVCVVASSAAVGSATQRNRAKRRLREIFRHQQHLVPSSCDLLLVARSSILKSPQAELEKKFSDACGQITPASPANS